MKVMIFVCGEGLGHTSRCISIGKELVSAGHDVHFGAYGYSRELIERKGFKTHMVPSEITLVGKAGSLNLKKSILATFKRGQFLGIIKIRKFLKRTKPDVVISDSYFMGMLSAKSRSIPCYLIVNQSNMEEFFKGKGVSSKILAELVKKFYTGMFKMADKVIIPDFPLPHAVCRKNLDFKEKTWKKVFFSGPLIGKTFEETIAKELEKPHVLCTVGGFGYREPIFRKVIEAAGMDKSINYTLLSGPSVDPASLGTLPENVTILKFIDDQFPYMKASDLVIAPGGHSTMMEALSFGVPMITVPDQKHSEQQNNALVIEEDGLGKMLDYSTSPDVILENIRVLIDDEKYKKKLTEMRELAVELNGPGAVRLLVEEMEN
ncbi:UDP-N-acetylglucosamine--N-acetylmuramyl-(pentapeptide) pyrophosphoryl-undecaprenol N-acetylglucosamine transferase [Methanolobus vulcani]|uniref:UDP-N-acetylglucosamine--N-acetylmuramyl-(Pentapeptide) pyrophosphoryl-undecaprenol N-acetylglucosamine transferase n=1 Tax=Methanolobus vulcani TaxID=38026 RepID=A0A7Z8P490_9EURY|nr:UDP-N-acetylglucosamine--N-acetylmuramyl-(pentapeptide) pyrophosphoryl-undecaprenol N-acetylglucosamine transferase [Methanolobus vulcani]TQD23810.1 UDP-N-acetylglucosamine--N-acetylmuramyl-(pentapeptide) pyrophosphoryl-undecaprenol N-acetylglucosamine transferase [Methanolobus vulcani]